MMDEADEARKLSALSWQAVEGFNFSGGKLKPNARRLGIALVSVADKKTGAIFPSELYLAGLLDLTTRAVRSAKAELKRSGLINWTNPGGPRHRSRYTVNWSALIRLAQDGKRRAADTVSGGDIPRRDRNERSVIYRNGDSASDSDGTVQPENLGTPTGTDVPSIRNGASTEHSHYHAHYHSQQEVGACALESAAPPVSQAEDTERIEALEKEAVTTRQVRSYPKLWETFENDQDAIDCLELCDCDRAAKASAALARHGSDKARFIIMGTSA